MRCLDCNHCKIKKLDGGPNVPEMFRTILQPYCDIDEHSVDLHSEPRSIHCFESKNVDNVYNFVDKWGGYRF